MNSFNTFITIFIIIFVVGITLGIILALIGYKLYIIDNKKKYSSIPPNEVRIIQQKLNDVMESNLVVDGVIGPKTIKVIDEYKFSYMVNPEYNKTPEYIFGNYYNLII